MGLSNLQFVLLAIALPWIVNLTILVKRSSKHSDSSHVSPLIIGWFGLLAAILLPLWAYNSRDYDSVDALTDLLEQIIDRVSVATLHIMRYVLPFAVYPLVVFWLKLLLNYRTDVEETAYWENRLPSRNINQQRQQAQLITFAIKVMIMIYIFFDVLSNVGIDASEVIQITTVFSLGLSWSMRDWLSRCAPQYCLFVELPLDRIAS